MNAFRHGGIGVTLAQLATAVVAQPGLPSPQPLVADRLHASAVAYFRAGRFPEAYGRFVSLAEAGHPASARYALWMCEQGPALFGKDWDCGPEQIVDWARAAGVVAPTIGPRTYQAAVQLRRPKQR